MLQNPNFSSRNKSTCFERVQNFKSKYGELKPFWRVIAYKIPEKWLFDGTARHWLYIQKNINLLLKTQLIRRAVDWLASKSKISKMKILWCAKIHQILKIFRTVLNASENWINSIHVRNVCIRVMNCYTLGSISACKGCLFLIHFGFRLLP